MIPDFVLPFVLGILTCTFCFFLFRDIFLMHLFKNSQAVQITPEGLKDLEQLEADVNSKLATYIQVLIQVRQALVVLYTSVQHTGETELISRLEKQIQDVDKELKELEKQGLIERENEK